METEIEDALQAFVGRRCRETRDALAASYLPLVRCVAAKVARRLPSQLGRDREELAGWGALGLLRAIDRFDPSGPAPFKAYAIIGIRWSILNGVKRDRATARSLSAATADGDGSLLDRVAGSAPPASSPVEYREWVDWLCEDLTGDERCVFKTHAAEGATMGEAAEEIGVSERQAWRLWQRSLPKVLDRLAGARAVEGA